MSDTLISPIETVDLSEIVDPSLPCEYVRRDGDACEETAVWVVHIRGHCIDAIIHRLFCDDCLGRLKAGDRWHCRQCNEYDMIKKYIIRIEPL